jgi:hypothetical protein
VSHKNEKKEINKQQTYTPPSEPDTSFKATNIQIELMKLQEKIGNLEKKLYKHPSKQNSKQNSPNKFVDNNKFFNKNYENITKNLSNTPLQIRDLTYESDKNHRNNNIIKQNLIKEAMELPD